MTQTIHGHLLFNLASVEKAIGQAQQVASISLTEVAVKALIKVKSRLGTPLAKKHSRSSTSVESHPRPGPTQQRFSKPLPCPTSACLGGHRGRVGSMGSLRGIPFHSFSPSQVPRHLGCYSTDSKQGRDLTEEVTVLFNKGAVEEAPPTPGFYTQEIVYLGVNIRTPLLKAFLTQTQVDNLLSHLQAFMDSRLLTTKEGIHLSTLNNEAQQKLHWADDRAIVFRPQFISGSRNVMANSLSQELQVISTEWSLYQDVCRALWQLWGMSFVDLFPHPQSELQAHCICLSIPRSHGHRHACFSLPLGPHKSIHLSTISVDQATSVQALGASIIPITLFWPCNEWFLDQLQVTVNTPCLLPTQTDLLRQPHFHHFHTSLHALWLTTWKLCSDSSVISAISEELQNSWRDLDSIQPL
ncbi:hypothetical protein E2C01_050208 [Portunus trituberculatus]|uniref:Uncharacterized protein n=1 Tax=Portunus trituberculatus TaxID=210409 RepID=A0A5B7GFU5_PORTR|nr:hypothetical protein [Portunus trituberculatus]